MANFSCDWQQFVSIALVVVGWLFFAAGLLIENPVVKALSLVAARALPHVLTSPLASIQTRDGRVCPASRNCAASLVAGSRTRRSRGEITAVQCLMFQFATDPERLKLRASVSVARRAQRVQAVLGNEEAGVE